MRPSNCYNRALPAATSRSAVSGLGKPSINWQERLILHSWHDQVAVSGFQDGESDLLEICAEAALELQQQHAIPVEVGHCCRLDASHSQMLLVHSQLIQHKGDKLLGLLCSMPYIGYCCTKFFIKHSNAQEMGVPNGIGVNQLPHVPPASCLLIKWVFLYGA